MTTAPVPFDAPHERQNRFEGLELRHAYTAFAIASMWIAVALSCVYGTNIVTTTVTDHAIVPSGIVVAFFAFLATIPVAAFGFRGGRR